MIKKILKKIYPFSIFFQMKSDIAELKKLNIDFVKQISNMQQVNSNNLKELQNLKKETQELKKETRDLKKQTEQLKKQVPDLVKKYNKLNGALEYWTKNFSGQLIEKYNMLNRKMEYLYYKGLHPDQYETALKDWYLEKTGKKIDFKNPITYNEKMQWLKLHDKNPMLSTLADKFKVRTYVKDKIGDKYLIPLIAVFDEVEDIDFDKLPQKYVMKANHGCGYNIIVRDKNLVDWEADKKKLKEWLLTDFSFRNGLELQYSNINRKIIVEEYIENFDNDLYDYKVFCFDGKAKFIMFLSERSQKLKMQFYDLEWNLQPFVYSYERKEEPIEKPSNLEELIYIAESLAAGFIQVRVDFYQLNSGEWKFGEMTFTSSSGMCKWEPPIYDKIMGEYIMLPMED